MRNDLALGLEGWTVDTPEDLEFVRRLVSLMPTNDFTWREAWAWSALSWRVNRPATVVLVPAGREHSAFFLRVPQRHRTRCGTVAPTA